MQGVSMAPFDADLVPLAWSPKPPAGSPALPAAACSSCDAQLQVKASDNSPWGPTKSNMPPTLQSVTTAKGQHNCSI